MTIFAPSQDAHAQRLCKLFEGCRLKAYFDPGGVLTIGWGHTSNVIEGQRITERQAEGYFQSDWAVAKGAVRRNVKVDISNAQRAALTMFVFNIGERQFAASTLLFLINEKRFAEADEQFARWVHDNGKVLPGLVVRRAVERLVFAGLAKDIDPPFVKILRAMV